MSIATDLIGGVIAGFEDLVVVEKGGWKGAGIGITIEGGGEIDVALLEPCLVESFLDIVDNELL